MIPVVPLLKGISAVSSMDAGDKNKTVFIP
jgi:hypothetical protein